MTQLARPLFIVLLVVGAIVISATTDHLPAGSRRGVALSAHAR